MVRRDLKFLANHELAIQYRLAAKLMNEDEQPFTAHVDVVPDDHNPGKLAVHIAFLGELPAAPDGQTDWRAVREPLDNALNSIKNQL